MPLGSRRSRSVFGMPRAPPSTPHSAPAGGPRRRPQPRPPPPPIPSTFCAGGGPGARPRATRHPPRSRCLCCLRCPVLCPVRHRFLADLQDLKRGEVAITFALKHGVVVGYIGSNPHKI